MEKYQLYIPQLYYRPEHCTQPKAFAVETVEWQRVVLADSYRAALEKCLPAIRRELPKMRDTVKYVSVYVGKKQKNNPGARASRLSPIQVVRETGLIRQSR